MENSLVDVSENSQLSYAELDPASPANHENAPQELSYEVDQWYGSDDELNKTSDLDREWQIRRNQFHAVIGYRDGLMAGKEAAAQEGFNVGFKQSVFKGFKWGLVRGVTSVLACLPNELKDHLVETQEKKNKFHCLNECVSALSTTDALKLFHDDMLAKKSVEETKNIEASSQDQNLDSYVLGNYFGELQSLLLESPAIKVHLVGLACIQPAGLFLQAVPGQFNGQAEPGQSQVNPTRMPS